MIQGSNLSGGKRFLSFPETSGRALGHTQPPIHSVPGALLGGKLSGRELNHPASSAVVKIEWSYTTAPPRCLHGVTRENFPFTCCFRAYFMDFFFFNFPVDRLVLEHLKTLFNCKFTSSSF